MSKFCALKSAGMGNRLKIYVSYLARYDEVMVEKEEDRYLFPDFKPCNREEDIKENPWTHSGWRLLVDQNEEDYIKTFKTIDQLYNNTPRYFIDKYVPIWKSLKINPEIKNYIDDFTKDWDKDDMVAIHIRTNYPPVDDGTRSVWVDFEGFEREVQKYPSTQKFFFYISAILLLLSYLFCKWLVNKRFGRILLAIRDDEARVRFSGYNPVVYKTIIFT